MRKTAKLMGTCTLCTCLLVLWWDRLVQQSCPGPDDSFAHLEDDHPQQPSSVDTFFLPLPDTALIAGLERPRRQASDASKDSSDTSTGGKAADGRFADGLGEAGAQPPRPDRRRRTAGLNAEGNVTEVPAGQILGTEQSHPSLTNSTASLDVWDAAGAASCRFNACTESVVCFHGGICTLNTTSCAAQCDCRPPYDDPWHYDQFCKSLVSAEESGTRSLLRNLSERDCGGVGQFVCRHGFCKSIPGGLREGTAWNHRCECDSGWGGVFCEYRCVKNCSNGGVCEFRTDAGDGDEVCRCARPWTGDHCTERLPVEGVRLAIKASAGVIAGIALSGLLSAALLYWMYRKRWMLALRIAYHFRKSEDEDGRHYDAFVSYATFSSEDRKFVQDDLIAQLEERQGFVLCVESRDISIRVGQPDAIRRAVTTSRRFIFVLSRSYLSSARRWPGFDLALKEMLHRKKCVIPVALDDVQVTPRDSRLLWAVLKGSTLIRFPGATATPENFITFWKRLCLCLPKHQSRGSSSRGRRPSGRRVESCSAEDEDEARRGDGDSPRASPWVSMHIPCPDMLASPELPLDERDDIQLLAHPREPVDSQGRQYALPELLPHQRLGNGTDGDAAVNPADHGSIYLVVPDAEAEQPDSSTADVDVSSQVVRFSTFKL